MAGLAIFKPPFLFLRVLKMTGLRVIDVSIMPIIMTGNPYASAVMIGELGSDFIKNDWKNQNWHAGPGGMHVQRSSK
jgi:choline dehydrogenase-like flavoprotein